MLRPQRVVTRAQLRTALWGESHVDWQAGLHQCIRQIRRSLGDDAREPRFVETVPRVGYRFVAPVTLASSPANRAEVQEAVHRRFAWGSFLSGVAATVAVPMLVVVLCALLA